VYGYRKYFADRDRGSIMRLSRDGLTEISEYGMSNFFRDILRDVDENYKSVYNNSYTYASNGSTVGPPIEYFINLTTNANELPVGAKVLYELTPGSGIYANASVTGDEITIKKAVQGSVTVYVSIEPRAPLPGEVLVFEYYDKDKITGGWDTYDRFYTVSIKDPVVGIAPTKAGDINEDGFNQTVVFDEAVLGWTSRYSYVPDFIFSIKNDYLTTKSGQVWKHNNTTSNTRNVFYGAATQPSAIQFVFNNNPSINKNFLTLGYEGSNGWQCDSFNSDVQRAFEVPNDYADPASLPGPPDYETQQDEGVHTLPGP
jgi:hypothetical protein